MSRPIPAVRRAMHRRFMVRVITVMMPVAGTFLFTGPLEAVDRDWARAELAWRDDPRPPADTPAGVDVPSGRRLSRRAQRRMARQRDAVDESPVQTVPSGTGPLQAFDAIEAAPPAALVPARDAPPAPIRADATLASPFATAASGATPHRDQPYGTDTPGRPRHARQRFDIYLPAGCSAGGMPLVVWIHGDTWRDGSKSDCPVTWLAEEGYAVASIGYRLTDAATYPAQLDDCRAAIAEIERNADVWGIDRDRVAVVGSGGGGHLAALVGLATTEPQASEAGPEPPRVAAICTVAAPSDLSALGPEQDRPGSAASRLVGGPLPEFREAARRASPVAHVSADDPPVLVLHGAADAVVPPRQAAALHATLEAAGADSTLVMLPGVGHRLRLDRASPGGQALLSFLDRVLGPGLRSTAP